MLFHGGALLAPSSSECVCVRAKEKRELQKPLILDFPPRKKKKKQLCKWSTHTETHLSFSSSYTEMLLPNRTTPTLHKLFNSNILMAPKHIFLNKPTSTTPHFRLVPSSTHFSHTHPHHLFFHRNLLIFSSSNPSFKIVPLAIRNSGFPYIPHGNVRRIGIPPPNSRICRFFNYLCMIGYVSLKGYSGWCLILFSCKQILGFLLPLSICSIRIIGIPLNSYIWFVMYDYICVAE